MCVGQKLNKTNTDNIIKLKKMGVVMFQQQYKIIIR